MKVGILSESEADEAALGILVAGLLGRPIEQRAPLVRARGFDAVMANLARYFKHLHFHTDVTALVVVVDSDYTPVRDESHEAAGCESETCRLCRLASVFARERSLLPPRPVGSPLKVAFGLAVPQIEAWYLCGVDPHVSEATWANAIKHKGYPYNSRRLGCAKAAQPG